MKILLVLALLGACDTDGDVAANDVITSIVAAPATLPADGASISTLTVKTVPRDVKDGLSAKLTIQGASWRDSKDAAIERDFGPDGTLTAAIVASRITGTATVLVEVAGYSRLQDIELDDAVPTETAITTSGRLEAGKVSQIQVSVQPLVPSGAPSAGTIVEFSLTTLPAETGFLTTSKVVMDASSNTASTTVVASTTTTSGVVDVTVKSPHSEGTAVTKSVAFTLLP